MATAQNTQEVRILEIGWNTPETTYIHDHVREMEKLPFTGLVLDFVKDAGPTDTSGHFSWNLWDPNLVRAEEYSKSIQALKQTRFHRFTDNLLRVNVTPGRTDWFDEKGMDAIMKNIREAGKLAKECGLKGIWFDVERYQGYLWRYTDQKQTAKYNLVQYRKQVRKYGRRFMENLQSEFPGISILTTYGYQMAYRHKVDRPEKNLYGLLPAFLDGMLDSAEGKTMIHDGWEFAYEYRTEKEFQDAYRAMRKKGEIQTGSPDQFRKHYRAGFGLWIDCNSNDVKQGWHPDKVRENYFTPEQFSQVVGYARKYTDRYIWIYSERARWWKDRNISPAYIKSLESPNP